MIFQEVVDTDALHIFSTYCGNVSGCPSEVIIDVVVSFMDKHRTGAICSKKLPQAPDGILRLVGLDIEGVDDSYLAVRELHG